MHRKESMASIISVLIISTLVLVSWVPKCIAQTPLVPGLSYSFYSSSCPHVQWIVGRYLWDVFQNDTTQAAGLLRLHFHDCFVQGCDGSVLLDGTSSNPSEKDAIPNLTLRTEAFKIINDLQTLITSQCGLVVSCADLATLAARDAVLLTGGPYYQIPLGRRDSFNFASQSDTLGNLPPPFAQTNGTLGFFAAKNLTVTDTVALSGGHTIGRSHCSSFTDRLYPNQDPTMDTTFAENLKVTCPTSNSPNTTVLDVRTPNTFDNKYFVDLVNRQGLFTSDQDLFTDSRTKDIVTSFANNQTLFFENFVSAMIKMSQIEVLTGSQGEIRANCSVRNPTTTMGLRSVVDDHQPGASSQL